MYRNNYVVLDKRSDSPVPEDVRNITVGAVVAYPSESGDTRRGIVIRQTPQFTYVLDGADTVRLHGERRDAVKMLATSAEAYARRTATETNVMRVRHGWCSVPSNMIREVNSTPIQTDPLLVVVKATQAFMLAQTSIGARRQLKIDEAVKTSFLPNDLGGFDHRTFMITDPIISSQKRKYSIELVDELPAQF